jgi:hypothetical protein
MRQTPHLMGDEARIAAEKDGSREKSASRVPSPT